MINARWLIFVLAVSLLTPFAALSHSTGLAQAQPLPPAVLAGTAWLDGTPAPVGVAIPGNAEKSRDGRGLRSWKWTVWTVANPRPLDSGPVYFLIGDSRASYELTWRSGFLKADVELRAAGDVPAATATPRPILATPLPTDTPTRLANTVLGP